MASLHALLPSTELFHNRHSHSHRHCSALLSSSSSDHTPYPLFPQRFRASFDARHRQFINVRLSNFKHKTLDSSIIFKGRGHLSVVAYNDEHDNGEDDDDMNGFLSVHANMVPSMKKGYGAFGGGATLEKSKLDLSQTTTRFSPLTEDGGGGGDSGNKINQGGGDGGDDGGDDDDYFGDADDEDDGDEGGFFQRRLILPEIFDRKIVEAILQEWYKTMADLPAGLRQAMEMGFISSAQMVRYISNFGRPTLARLLSRAIPPSASRGFVGRMIADPGFMYKMCYEQTVTVALGTWWELKHRKERIKVEWILACLNILALCLCNAAIVWSLAPCRSYGSTFKFNLQNTIQKLPNNVFERSYAFREFDMLKRIQSFFYKAGELCLAGLLTGAVSGALTNLVIHNHDNVSVPVPALRTNALAYGAFLGLSGNLRYQFLYGAERVMVHHFNHVGTMVFCSALLRAMNIYVGDATRVSWLGLDEVLEQSADKTQQAYQRPSVLENPLKDWSSINKFLPFIRNGNSSAQRKPRKRRIRKVMMAG